MICNIQVGDEMTTQPKTESYANPQGEAAPDNNEGHQTAYTIHCMYACMHAQQQQ